MRGREESKKICIFWPEKLRGGRCRGKMPGVLFLSVREAPQTLKERFE